MELNDRQRQQLSTCMPSCRNIAYPTLGLLEEVGEYAQKLIYMIRWNPDFPDSERAHLTMLIQGIITNAEAIGTLNKAIRHGKFVQPFALKHQPSASVQTWSEDAQWEPAEFWNDRMEALQKELGDIDWMTSCAHYYTVHPDADDPTLPEASMTLQDLADQNYRKLAERRAQGTIDARGDNQRTKIE